MQTTLDIRDRLLEEARDYAAERQVELDAVVDEALTKLLQATRENAAKPDRPDKPFRVIGYGSGGLRPGVDLSNNAQVRDIMDGLIDPEDLVPRDE